jgi:uncharacterized protein YndB with AHSA1/START domain
VRPQRTVVTLRFAPSGENETQVTLRHMGWGDGGQWDQNFDYFDRAWPRVLANFQKRFADARPIDWTPYRAQMQAAVAAGNVKQGVAIPAASGPRTLRQEIVVPAPPAEVWKAFATVDGVRKWVAPVVELDLRPGGKMLTHYDAKASIGNPGTIRLGIVSVVERELITYKVNLTERFPARARNEDQNLQQVVQLLPVEGGKTRVVFTMIGWGSGAEWDETYAFFEKGNALHVRKLADAYSPAR